jgi:hypothetical protein
MFIAGHKYIVIVVVQCLIFNFLSVLAQPDLQKPISIDAQDKTLVEVLEQISTAGGINFSYSPFEIISERRISLSVKEMPVSVILDSLCTELNLEYFVVEEQVVLKAAGENEQVKSGYRKDLFSLSGYVYDRKTGEVLIGANILIEDPAVGVITNPFGFYSITLPRGLYILKLSYVGFKKSIIPIILDTNIVRDFHLDQEISSMQEVIIRNDYEGEVSGRTQMSQLKLEPRTVSVMPALLGEPDVIKSLQSVPGINLMGDGSTLFFVRGGNKDQNLILLDDAPIYMPSHMLGFFSTIVPDAVKEIKIFKGDMPAEYGGRLSSLIDIRSKDGNMYQWGVRGSFGLVSVKGTVEGPVVKGRSSLFLSGRRSYFGWFVDQFVPDLNKMNFSDLTGKFNFRINDNNRLYFSGYAGRDYFSEGPSASDLSGMSWQNLTGSFRWNHLFSDKLFSNTTVYASKYDYSLVTDPDRNNVWHARIANISSKTDFTWYRSPENTIRVGGLFSYHSFNPGNYESGIDTKAVDFPIISMKYATETALYFSDSRNIFNWLSIRYGARVNLWMNSGRATEYSFNDNHQVTDTSYYKPGEVYNLFITLEPRIGVSFRINPATSISIGYSTTVQHIHLITNTISPFTTVEVWLPSGPNIKPEIADIITAGFFRRLHYPEMEFSIEAFYKHMRNQIDYTDHAQMLLNPLVESELRFGSSESAGLEILLKKDYGRLTGWIGYTFSHATRKISGINNNKPYPASWDRPNDLSLFVAYDISKRINISANWIYMTGSAFSSPVSFYYYNGRSIPLYAEKNNDRLPDYHRLDLSAIFDLNKNDEKFDHNLVLSIWNIYNRKNPIAINFNKIKTEEGDIVVPTNFIKQPHLYSTQLYLFGIMPSITYNFRF